MKLRLELEVEYEDDEDPGADLKTTRQELDSRLLAIAQHAAGVGLLTDDLPVVVSTWEARVVEL